MEASSFGRLLGVLLSPRRTFEAIAERPTWLVALLALTLLGSVSVWAALSRIDPESLARSVVEQSGRELPPQMDAEKLHLATLWSGVAAAVIFSPLTYLAAAGIFLVGLRLAGSDMDFRRSLSVTLHGLMPFSLAAVVGIPVALAKEDLTLEQIQGGGILASNLSSLAGEDGSFALTSLLASVDLFSIWCVVLLSIGFAVVGRISRGAAATTVCSVWLLGVALKVALAALK